VKGNCALFDKPPRKMKSIMSHANEGYLDGKEAKKVTSPPEGEGYNKVVPAN